jgi:predicted nuclease of predicted toxin-antitoxin system
MKFKIDENLPIEAAEILRQAGHDALTVYDQYMSGNADAQIASACQQEGRVIVSLDLDFADIRAYPPKDFAGLIVLRLKQQDKIHVLEIFERLLKSLSSEQLEKRLWIVDESNELCDQ